MSHTTLHELYERIASCTRCADRLDPSKARRVRAASPTTSDLFIVSQALAEKTQRVTGVPFARSDGSLSSTGERLEAFLNLVDYTLRPPHPIELSGGMLHIGARDHRQAYNSEIIQCFPGRHEGQKGDAFPADVAQRCLDQGFLEQEIVAVNPRILLLLGSRTTRTFMKRFGSSHALPPITEILESFSSSASVWPITVGGRERLAIPLIHPSGMTAGKFRRLVVENRRLVDFLRRLLAENHAATAIE